MNKEKQKTINPKRMTAIIISNSVIWGLVIIGTALALKGTGTWSKIMPILGGGAAFSLSILQTALLGKK